MRSLPMLAASACAASMLAGCGGFRVLGEGDTSGSAQPCGGFTRLLGTSAQDNGRALAPDGDALVVAGWVSTFDEDGEPRLGDLDLALWKTTREGELLWSAQFGSGGEDYALALAVGPEGHVWLAGKEEQLDEEGDVVSRPVVARLDSEGQVVWWRTPGEAGEAIDIVVDITGSAFVALGTPHDPTILGIDPVGETGWALPLEEQDAQVQALGLDASGNVLVVGTEQPEGEPDSVPFLRALAPDGEAQWVTHWGARWAVPWAVAVDPGEAIYVTGESIEFIGDGEPHDGYRDVFVTRFEPGGERDWTLQTGSSATEVGYAIAVNEEGNAVVAGTSSGDFATDEPTGLPDLILLEVDPEGNEVGRQQWGTADPDVAYAIAVDEKAVYVAGRTSGDLDGEASNGGDDAFVTRRCTPAG